MRYSQIVLATVGLWLGMTVSAAFAAEGDFADLERQFQQLPIEARRLIGPLFWLHGDESRQRLEMYVGKVAEGGNGCFTAESRPHNDWLGPGWWRDLAICLEAAKKHNLQDVDFRREVVAQPGDRRPSAAALCRQTPGRPLRVDVEGPSRWHRRRLRRPPLHRRGGRPHHGRRQDRRPIVSSIWRRTSATASSRWQVPAGKMEDHEVQPRAGPAAVAERATERRRRQQGLRRLVPANGLSAALRSFQGRFRQDDSRLLLRRAGNARRLGHRTESRRWPSGKSIGRRPMSPTSSSWPARSRLAAKYQYLDAFAETWGRTMYGGMTDWCHAARRRVARPFHGARRPVPSTRVLRRRHDAAAKAIATWAASTPCFRSSSSGKRGRLRCPHAGRRPKLASSISHVFGKQDDVAMVEIFGGRGQDLTYPEMKWWADHMQVSGVNFLIPHSFNPRSPYDTDCPPYFYNGGFEPRWPLYRVFAELRQPAEPDARPAAGTSARWRLLFGGNTLGGQGHHAGGHDHRAARCPIRLRLAAVRRVRVAGFDWRARRCKLYGERYRVLVVPPVEVIPYATLAKAKEFFDAGGVVVGYGFLPSKSATIGKISADIAALCRQIWGDDAKPGLTACKTNAAGGRSYLLSQTPTPRRGRPQALADAGVHPTPGSARRRDRRLAARAAPRQGRPRRVLRLPIRTTKAPRGSSSSAPRPPASPNAGTPCGTKSRRSPSDSSGDTAQWSFR